MKTEHKELLLKDLCARLPYGVKVSCIDDFNHDWYNLELVDVKDGEAYISTCEPYYSNKYTNIESIRSYLFPLSSITEEQKKELYDKLIELELKSLNDEISRIEVVKFEIEYYLKNHLDYKGLIPLGLAIDATNKNIY